jgi:hypothetical protein
MKAKDFLSKFPKKLFSEAWEEREKELISRNAAKGEIDNKKKEYIKIFDLDNVLIDIEEILEINPDLELNSHIEGRLLFYIDEINDFISWLSQINLTTVNNMDSVFSSFNTQLKSRSLFQIVNIDNQGRNVGTGIMVIEEHINELITIFNFLKSKDKGVQELEEISSKLIKNKDKLIEATRLAESFIESKTKGVGVSLEDKIDIFEEKSKEHKTFRVKWKRIFPTTKKFWGWMRYPSGSFIWIIFAVFSGASAVKIIFYFIHEAGTVDLSVGLALMRISALIIPSYFAFFCGQRFLEHRKLYEFYKFKAVALKTMEDLYKNYTEVWEQKSILDKAISIIFLEPLLDNSHEVPSKRDLLDVLINFSKNKINP